jgi:hypothetical protein
MKDYGNLIFCEQKKLCFKGQGVGLCLFFFQSAFKSFQTFPF